MAENRLVRGITSQYIEAANRLKPKHEKRRIVAYVESYDDVAFWRLLLDEFEDEKTTFQIMLPTGGDLTKGKKSALKKTLDASVFGNCLIACVDSDYDYVLQGHTYTSKEILENPYVIQTYTYAIENYLCYAGSLHQIAVQCTLNDRMPVDLEAFMGLFSEIIFPLFCWNVWFYRKRLHSQFSMQDFNNVTTIETIDFRNPRKCLDRLAIKVSRKLTWLEANWPDAVKEVAALQKELQKLGVKPDQTYLYIQGHHLMDTVIPKIMGPILSSLASERENEIRKLAAHEQQLQNELQAYRHSQTTLFDALHRNTHYRDSAPYQRMRKAVKALIKRINTPPAEEPATHSAEEPATDSTAQ